MYCSIHTKDPYIISDNHYLTVVSDMVCDVKGPLHSQYLNPRFIAMTDSSLQVFIYVSKLLVFYQ
jgi:hypothetical protein